MKKIVTIGGGTGSYNVLSGIKEIEDVSISALVSMADNGGSTGRLRDELGVLPPGDIRQCLVALSDHTAEIRKIMNYRFLKGDLKGHTFGNIFLATLEKVSGSFAKGVEIASLILKTKGEVVPITTDKADLVAKLRDNKIIKGQVGINSADIQKFGLKKLYFKNKVSLNSKAEKIIKEADYIIIGPGDYYGSVLPNVIVDGFKKAILKTKAKIIFPVNFTNKKGQNLHWIASDYVKDLESYLGREIDVILINNKRPSPEQVKRYKLKEGDGVLIKDDIKNKGVVRANLISHRLFQKSKSDKVVRSFIRHDSTKIRKAIENIIKKDNAKLILDFDDVLFNTEEFKKYLFLCIEEYGISKKIAEKKYTKVRKLNSPFSLKTFLSLLFNGNKSELEIKDLYKKILSKNLSFVNEKLFSILKQFGKENCYLVTNGDRDFQMDKINKSGVKKFFHLVKVTPGSKKKIIENICKNNLNSYIYFIDDKNIFLEDLDTKKYKNLKVFLRKDDNLNKILKKINKFY